MEQNSHTDETVRVENEFEGWIGLVEATEVAILDGFTNGLAAKFVAHMNRHEDSSANLKAIVHSNWWVNRALHNSRRWFA
tara:strand:- start:135 stop:374 length:240 start_codon:yes stop_codon:yes gene_type:complete